MILSRPYKIHTPEEDPFQNSAAFVEKSLFPNIIWPAISKSIPQQRSINVNHVVKHTIIYYYFIPNEHTIDTGVNIASPLHKLLLPLVQGGPDQLVLFL
jgi:hypothetical protein